MTKYRPYSRVEFRRRRALWIRRNQARFVGITIGTMALLSVMTVVVVGLGDGTAFSWYACGLLQATLIGAYLHFMQVSFLAHDRESIWHLRGAWGEENTRDELLRAKRRRLIWGWVDSINLQAGDLDHLVVTRRGGVVAIDSKWRNQHQTGDALDMARAAHKAQLRAQGLAQTLLRNERGVRHRAASNPLRVRSVVVLWGSLQHAVPDGARVDGIDFVAGQRLVKWLAKLDGDTVDKDAAHDMLNRLREYRSTSRGRDNAAG